MGNKDSDLAGRLKVAIPLLLVAVVCLVIEEAWPILVWALFFAFMYDVRSKLSKALKSTKGIVALGAYLLLTTWGFLKIRDLREVPNGLAWTAILLFTVVAADSLAYLLGKKYGKKRPGTWLARMSPNKTYEGVAAALFGGWLFFFGGWFVASNAGVDLPANWMTVFGLTIPFLAVIGDLLESAVKRTIDVKDLGKLLVSHGGVPDRLDALLFVSATIGTVIVHVIY